MALTVYLDDSGTDAPNTHLVVAGFASEIDQWNRFNNEWKDVLDSFGVPFFKAKQFDGGRRGKGVYQDWDEKRRRAFMGNLLGIIKRRTFKSFGTLLEKNVFDYLTANKDLKAYFRSAFAFSVFNCMHSVTEWRNQYHPGTPLLFVVDAGNKNEGDLLEAGRHLKLKQDDRMIQDINTGDDRTLPPLQAADLLAFELCAETRRVEQRPRAYARYPLLELDEHPKDWLRVDAAALSKHVLKLIAEGRMELRDNENRNENATD
jgi:hypothetical protein